MFIYDYFPRMYDEENKKKVDCVKVFTRNHETEKTKCAELNRIRFLKQIGA